MWAATRALRIAGWVRVVWSGLQRGVGVRTTSHTRSRLTTRNATPQDTSSFLLQAPHPQGGPKEFIHRVCPLPHGLLYMYMYFSLSLWLSVCPSVVHPLLINHQPLRSITRLSIHSSIITTPFPSPAPTPSEKYVPILLYNRISNFTLPASQPARGMPFLLSRFLSFFPSFFLSAHQ